MISEQELSRAVQDAMNKDRRRNNLNRIVFVAAALVVFPLMILCLRYCGLPENNEARELKRYQAERARIEAERGHR